MGLDPLDYKGKECSLLQRFRIGKQQMEKFHATNISYNKLFSGMALWLLDCSQSPFFSGIFETGMLWLNSSHLG